MHSRINKEFEQQEQTCKFYQHIDAAPFSAVCKCTLTFQLSARCMQFLKSGCFV